MNHLEFAAAESAALAPTSWERWVADVEGRVGHDLDGDQATDGYSMDAAYVAFGAGLMPVQYAARVLASQQIVALEKREDWGGYGYLGERRHVHASIVSGEWPDTMWNRVAEADTFVVLCAVNNGWNDDRLFEWANSRAGRHFADEVFGRDDVDYRRAAQHAGL